MKRIRKKLSKNKPFSPGNFIENCGYYPCIVLESNKWEIKYYNLINNCIGFCSIQNCNPKQISEDDVISILEEYKKVGEFAIYSRKGWKIDQYNKFVHEWKNENYVICNDCSNFEIETHLCLIDMEVQNSGSLKNCLSFLNKNKIKE